MLAPVSYVGRATLRAAGYVVPSRLPTAEECPPARCFAAVVPHPRGGWTLALPVDATQSTARIYCGCWSSWRRARRALAQLFSS